MAGLSTAEIRDLFTQEAEIRLQQLGQLLLQLETSGDDETLVRSVFREIHTLKGSAAIAGLEEVSGCAHALEELVDELRSGKRRPTPGDIDQLLSGADRLAELIRGTPIELTNHVAPVVVREPLDLNAVPAVEPHTLVGVGVSSSLATREEIGTRARMAFAPAKSKAAAGAILVPTERLEELTRLIGQSASAHLRVGRMLKDRFGIDPASNAEYNELSRSLNDLQDRATRTQMVPVATITDQLQRAVRDLSRAQGKDVRWDARGTDTEMDRGVLLQLSDSLIHLVRNAVDHGIESIGRA